MSGKSSRETARIVELAEARGMAAFLGAVPREIASSLGIHAEMLGSAVVCSVPRIDFPLFNSAIGLGIDEDLDRERIDRVVEICGRNRGRRISVRLSPVAAPDPAKCRELLRERGFAQGPNDVKTYRDNAPAPEVRTDLVVRKAEGESDAAALAAVYSAAFDFPTEMAPLFESLMSRPFFHNYIAWDSEKPAAAATLYLDGDVGWFLGAGTVAQYRGRGAQSALMSRRLRDGTRLGCKHFVAETEEGTPEKPNPSHRNMIRAGFKVVYLRPDYVFENRAEAR